MLSLLSPSTDDDDDNDDDDNDDDSDDDNDDGMIRFRLNICETALLIIIIECFEMNLQLDKGEIKYLAKYTRPYSIFTKFITLFVPKTSLFYR